MLSSGIPIVRAIDITSEVVGSLVYKNLLKEVADGVKSGWLFPPLLKDTQIYTRNFSANDASGRRNRFAWRL